MKKVLKLLVILSLVNFLGGCNLFENYYRNDETLVDYQLDKFKEVEMSENKLILRDINFEYKSTFKEILDVISIWMKNNSATLHILVEGHCDERGNNEYNLVLGEQRSLAVRSYLIHKGIEKHRIQTISYGEEKPFDTGHDETSWKKNRRVHFLVANEN
jgi:peptidoglycan-associated lipoprotein